MAARLNQDIAVLFEFPTLNGGEHSMLSVLQHLMQNSRVRCFAMAPPDGPLADQLAALNIPVIPFSVRSTSGSRRSTPELAGELNDLILQHQPGLLHANSLSMSRLVGQAREDLPPICCTGHLRDIMKLSARAVRDLNCLDRLAAVSQATRDFHLAQGLEHHRAQVIYNGVDTGRFCRRHREDTRRTLLPQIASSATVVLNVGQICLRKGQLELAQAVVHLLDQGENMHLVLAGQRHSEKAESVAYEQAITDVFHAAGRADHLHRPGYCDNIEAWMNAADLLVHTARQEPLGRVLLEAAACELPILATDVGGTSEILSDRRTALLIPPGDLDALTSGIQEAVSCQDECRSMARQARRRIQEAFSVARAANGLLNFWQPPV